MNKLGIIITTIFFFNLTIIFAQKSNKEFEGIIEYEVKIGDKKSHQDNYYTYLGTKQILYYKQGKYRLDFYIDNVLFKTTFTYADSTFKYYSFVGDKYMRKTTMTNFKKNVITESELKEENNICEILNYKCQQIEYKPIENPQNKFIIYSSDDLKISSNARIIDFPYFLIKTHYLKYINKSQDKDSVVVTATKVKKISLNDSIFNFSRNNIIKYYSSSDKIKDLGDYFFKIENYKMAIIFYDTYLKYLEDLFADKKNGIDRRMNFYATEEKNTKYNKAVAHFKLNDNLSACEELRLIQSQQDKESHKLYKQYCSCNSLRPYYKKEINNSLVKHEYDKVIELCDKTLECNKNDTLILFIKGISNYNKKAFFEAYDSFVTAKDNGSVRAKEFIYNDFNKTQLLIIYNKKGDKYFKNKEYKAASIYYTLVLDKMNNSPSVLRKRGLSEIKLDNKTKGCVDLKRAMTNGDQKAKELIKQYCTINENKP